MKENYLLTLSFFDTELIINVNGKPFEEKVLVTNLEFHMMRSSVLSLPTYIMYIYILY